MLAQHSSKTNEWYTPIRYVEAAREVMGEIDLDPASCAQANWTVRAKRYYTQEDDALLLAWHGRVFLNPPYGRREGQSNQHQWTGKTITMFEAGYVDEVILLVNAATDTVWFQWLWDYTICFTNHRIAFYNAEGESSQPTHGNAFVYFGPNEERFIEVFKQFGPVIPKGVVRR